MEALPARLQAISKPIPNLNSGSPGSHPKISGLMPYPVEGSPAALASRQKVLFLVGLQL
jgi:hypothetical protein